MKFIYYTNNIVYGLTLVLYLTIIYGMIMQVFLGGVQLLLFIVLLFNFGKFSKTIKKHLMNYGIITTLFLLFFFFGIDPSKVHSNFQLSLYFVVPMCIGTYFTYIIYQLKRQVS